MFNLSSQELLIILAIALIVVGPQRLPELSRSIGKGLRELRKVQDDVKDMVKFDLEPDEAKPVRRQASPTSPGVHRTPKPAPTVPAPTADAASPGADGASSTADQAAGASPSDPGSTPAAAEDPASG